MAPDRVRAARANGGDEVTAEEWKAIENPTDEQTREAIRSGLAGSRNQAALIAAERERSRIAEIIPGAIMYDEEPPEWE